MSLPVVVLPEAERNVRDTVAWLHQRSPSGAEAWFHAWEEMLERLSIVAPSSVRAPEDATREIEIRQVTFKTRRGRPYRALFTIRDDIVYVMHVRGPRQNIMAPEDIISPDES